MFVFSFVDAVFMNVFTYLHDSASDIQVVNVDNDLLTKTNVVVDNLKIPEHPEVNWSLNIYPSLHCSVSDQPCCVVQCCTSDPTVKVDAFIIMPPSTKMFRKLILSKKPIDTELPIDPNLPAYYLTHKELNPIDSTKQIKFMLDIIFVFQGIKLINKHKILPDDTPDKLSTLQLCHEGIFECTELWSVDPSLHTFVPKVFMEMISRLPKSIYNISEFEELKPEFEIKTIHNCINYVLGQKFKKISLLEIYEMYRVFETMEMTGATEAMDTWCKNTFDTPRFISALFYCHQYKSVKLIKLICEYFAKNHAIIEQSVEFKSLDDKVKKFFLEAYHKSVAFHLLKH